MTLTHTEQHIEEWPLTHPPPYTQTNKLWACGSGWHTIRVGTPCGCFGLTGLLRTNTLVLFPRWPRKEVRLELRQSVSVLVPLLWETQLPGSQRCHGTNPDGQKLGAPQSMIPAEACSLVGTSPRDAVIGRCFVYKQIGADWSEVTSIDLRGDMKEIWP